MADTEFDKKRGQADSPKNSHKSPFSERAPKSEEKQEAYEMQKAFQDGKPKGRK